MKGKRPSIKSAIEETFARQLADLGIVGWERELRFHPERMWRFDFAWRAVKVAAEVEGGSFMGGKKCETCGHRPMGRHHSVQGHAADCEKYNAAACLGWRVLRFPSKEIGTGQPVLLVKKLLIHLGAHQ